MTTLNEGFHAAEFLISEGEGQISRENVIVTVAGAVALPAGQVLGKITATGKYVAQNDSASDGSQTAAAVLMNECPDVNGDYHRAVIVRLAEVWQQRLTGLLSTGAAELKSLQIIVRP